jgi:NADH-quinone oxidoreductase subunit K
MTVFEPWMLLVVSVAVFCIGLLGLILRKNLLVMLMSIELMLNAVNLCFVTFSKMHQLLDGHLTVLFVMTVAAAESAVGLGLVIAMFRNLRSVDSDQIQLLRD